MNDSGALVSHMNDSGALILFGLAYHETLRAKLAVDFRFSVSNYWHTLINGFLNRGSGADVFLCTADSAATPDLLRAYAPRRHLLLEHVGEVTAFSSASSMRTRNLRLLAAIQLCLDYAIERGRPYGMVVITRFDAFFTIPLRFLNVDRAAINIATHLRPFNMM